MFDGEGDVVLYCGGGYKVSGVNTQGIPMVLEKPDYFYSHPSMINNTANIVKISVRKDLRGQDNNSSGVGST